VTRWTAGTHCPCSITPGEVAAIATALSTVGATPFNPSGRSALRKIPAVLRDVDADRARALAQRIYLLTTSVSGGPGPRRQWRTRSWKAESYEEIAADMGLPDITRLTIYTTDVDEAMQHFDVFGARSGTVDAAPPMTVLGVTRLTIASLMFEIEANAAD